MTFDVYQKSYPFKGVRRRWLRVREGVGVSVELKSGQKRVAHGGCVEGQNHYRMSIAQNSNPKLARRCRACGWDAAREAPRE